MRTLLDWPEARTVIICEPIVSGTEHTSFNAGLIWIAALSTSAPVEMWADPEHFELVRALLPPQIVDRVKFTAWPPPPRRLPYRARIWRDAATAWGIVRHSARQGERHVIFSCAFPGTLIGAKAAMASLTSARRPTVHAVVHSSLEEVWNRRSRRTHRRGIDMTTALTWPAPPGFRIVVLEAGIATDLAQKLPRVASQLLVLEFPIVETASAHRPRRPGAVRVGFLGRANRERGFHRFCELARSVAERGAEVEFHAVGSIAPGAFAEAALLPLASRPQETPLERSAYHQRLGDVDLVVLLQDPNHYAHTASGVLLDAVAAGRPVLSMANPMVAAIAARYGAIGPQVDDLDVATDLLSTLDVAALDGPVFKGWRENLRRFALSRRPSELAVRYSRSFEE